MAGAGYRTFAAGEVLTAANTQTYLMDQTIAVFADAAARDAAITSPTEGQYAFLKDTDLLTYRSASAWVTFFGGGAPGSVLQVVSTTLTSTFTTASRSYTNLTGLSATITPVSTSSKIMIWVSIQGVTDTEGIVVGSRAGMLRLTGGNSASFVGDAAADRTRAVASFIQVDGASQRTMSSASGNFEDSPSTTSATTYQVQVIQPSAGTLYINRSEEDTNASVSPRGASTITLMEVAG